MSIDAVDEEDGQEDRMDDQLWVLHEALDGHHKGGGARSTHLAGCLFACLWSVWRNHWRLERSISGEQQKIPFEERY